MKPLERFGISIMCLWLLYAVHQGVNALVKAHNWQPLTASDWGTWVGAAGTGGAVLASFFLFQRQRLHELRKAADDELFRRTRSVQAVQDIAYHAIRVVDHCIEVREGDFHSGEVPDISPRLDELRAMLDRFVDPGAERVTVLTALILGNGLLETKSDARMYIDPIDDFVLDRMRERKEKMNQHYLHLLEVMLTLQQECRKRGIQV